MTDDKSAQKSIEQQDVNAKPDRDMPAAGPHARDTLTDHEKTPGTGSLPDKNHGDADVGSE